MVKKKRVKGSILRQVSLLFALGVLATGLITYFSQYRLSDAGVKRQTENLAEIIAGEVDQSLREYPACNWLIQYWYEHAGELDIEYDVDYGPGTETERKCRTLSERYPGLQLKYADAAVIQAMEEEDQKLFAEIVFSWLTTRIDQIKQANGVAYLFCVLTDDSFETQFFLLSGADPGEVRGTNYEETYTLGTTVTVSESQREAMRSAKLNNEHLADAGSYVDYYAFFGTVGGQNVLIGTTYDLSGLRTDVVTQTVQSTAFAVAYQLLLSLLCLWLIFFFVLRPLKSVQQNIRLYKNTKDSGTVIENLSKIHPDNEIGQLSEDVSDLAKEIDDYLERIESITAEKERIVTELNLAARIQADILPNSFPPFPDRKEFDIYATMDPAKEIGGDFYDFFLVDDDHLCLNIADVSGKGIPAALFMMATRILLADNAMLGKSPAEILDGVNTAVCDNNEEGMFVTVWVGILEISTGKLTAANAGHEYPVIKRANGSYELFRDKHGFVIGGMEGIRYKEYELQLEPGSKLFVYTDGVPEATNAENEMFGTGRLLASLNGDPDADPERTLKNMRKAVDGFVKEAEQFDDLTMLCLAYYGPGAGTEDPAAFEELTLRTVPESIQQVTDFIDARLEERGCPPKAEAEINVVIDEVFCNISSYAYGEETGDATVRFSFDEETRTVSISFADRGIPFDPLSREDPDVTLPAEEREPGGLGIFMVKKMMDAVEYHREDGCNVLTVRKKI